MAFTPYDLSPETIARLASDAAFERLHGSRKGLRDWSRKDRVSGKVVTVPFTSLHLLLPAMLLWPFAITAGRVSTSSAEVDRT
jgi:hypothetical protein